jgi:hypothetical protein
VEAVGKFLIEALLEFQTASGIQRDLEKDAKMTVRLKNGTVIEHEVQDYPSLASHPFTWGEEVQKFDRFSRVASTWD